MGLPAYYSAKSRDFKALHAHLTDWKIQMYPTVAIFGSVIQNSLNLFTGSLFDSFSIDTVHHLFLYGVL